MLLIDLAKYFLMQMCHAIRAILHVLILAAHSVIRGVHSDCSMLGRADTVGACKEQENARTVANEGLRSIAVSTHVHTFRGLSL